jgi:hypothetical protein
MGRQRMLHVNGRRMAYGDRPHDWKPHELESMKDCLFCPSVHACLSPVCVSPTQIHRRQPACMPSSHAALGLAYAAPHDSSINSKTLERCDDNGRNVDMDHSARWLMTRIC